MSNPFFEKPILNSPYLCPGRHWELDAHGQPTQKIIERRRRAEFITPIEPDFAAKVETEFARMITTASAVERSGVSRS